VRLGVRAKADTGLLAVVRHDLEVGLEGIEIDEKRRRGQVVFPQVLRGHIVGKGPRRSQAGRRHGSQEVAAMDGHRCLLFAGCFHVSPAQPSGQAATLAFRGNVFRNDQTGLGLQRDSRLVQPSWVSQAWGKIRQVALQKRTPSGCDLAPLLTSSTIFWIQPILQCLAPVQLTQGKMDK
jgi:hypothetical protein